MIDAKQKENYDHLQYMQEEIISELNSMKLEVKEGRRKIQDQINKQEKTR